MNQEYELGNSLGDIKGISLDQDPKTIEKTLQKPIEKISGRINGFVTDELLENEIGHCMFRTDGSFFYYTSDTPKNFIYQDGKAIPCDNYQSNLGLKIAEIFQKIHDHLNEFAVSHEESMGKSDFDFFGEYKFPINFICKEGTIISCDNDQKNPEKSEDEGTVFYAPGPSKIFFTTNRLPQDMFDENGKIRIHDNDKPNPEKPA